MGRGFASSSLLLFVSCLLCLTVNLPTISANLVHFRFVHIKDNVEPPGEKKRKKLKKKNIFPSKVKEHSMCLRYFCYSDRLANLWKTGTATVDPLGEDEDRTT